MEYIIVGKTLEEIVQEYSDTLMRIAYQYTKNMTDAEDMVQEVYIKLIKHKKLFETETHLKSWLIRVTINKCKDFLRSSWIRKTVQLSESMTLLTPEEEVVMAEIYDLKAIDRTIVYLYYYEGYKIDEISTLLGKKSNTISSRLQRARKKLKDILLEGGLKDENKLPRNDTKNNCKS